MEHLLNFKNFAESFGEAIPLGNGRIGAMVYGKPGKEKISLNEDTIWSGYEGYVDVPENAIDAFKKAGDCAINEDYKTAEHIMENEVNAKRCQIYMPLGSLYVDFGHINVSNYERELDLETAVASVSYTHEGHTYKREYLVSKEKQCLIMNVSSDEKFSINISFETLHRITDIRAEQNMISFFGKCPSDGHIKRKETYIYDEKGTEFVCTFGAVTETGQVTTDEKVIKVENTDKVTVYVAINTDYQNDSNLYEECKKQIAACGDFELEKANAIKEYQEQYNRVRLKLTDTEDKRVLIERLQKFDGSDLGIYELLFNYGRYLIIASSQPNTQATNLQGIWNEKWVPEWSCSYTTNINTQMNYWPVLSTNLAECFEPFMSFVKKVSYTGKKTARDFYGARGFVCHHNSDIWGHSNQGGGGEFGNSHYACWNMGSGWLACQLFDYYEYTEDKETLLDEIYPIMLDAARFYLDIMRVSDGYYIIAPTISPENRFIANGEKCAISKTATMSISIVQDLFGKILRAEQILGLKSEISEEIREKLSKLFPLQIGENGTLNEWDREYEEVEPQHRHNSHLYALHPGELITVDATPDLANACRETLKRRGDAGPGWSLIWKSICYSKLKDGNSALKLLERMLNLVSVTAVVDYFNGGGIYPNLFCAHPPFQIDGNFGATACISNMLLQSSDGLIEILPAIPDEWKNGSVNGLKAKGNIEVSIAWINGKAKKVVLKSCADKQIEVKMNSQIRKVALHKGTPVELI